MNNERKATEDLIEIAFGQMRQKQISQKKPMV
jgi:hypothetical protein